MSAMIKGKQKKIKGNTGLLSNSTKSKGDCSVTYFYHNKKAIFSIEEHLICKIEITKILCHFII